MLITFSGLDGAGKTTLIDWLVLALERERVQVAVCHMNRGVGVHAALRAMSAAFRSATARMGRPGRERPMSDRVPEARAAARWDALRARARRARDAVVWSRGLRRMLYPIDLLVFICYRLYVERSGRVLIMDRYFYDTLVDVADGRRWGLLRLYERVTPTPTIPIFLDVGPEECFARKHEFSVEYLQRRWQTYHAVLPWIPSAVRVAANDLDATKATLRELVLRRIAMEGRS